LDNLAVPKNFMAIGDVPTYNVEKPEFLDTIFDFAMIALIFKMMLQSFYFMLTVPS
jgi:hypothetical protein